MEDNEKSFCVLDLITFGNISAEYETDSLRNYFVETSTYINLKNKLNKKIFYIGHRGSGKSALFGQLNYELCKNNKNIVVSITPQHFSYEIFSNVQHQCYDMKSIYGAVWHYTIITLIFKSIYETSKSQKFYGRADHDLAAIKDYLLKNNLAEEDTTSIFFSFFNKFSISRTKIKIDNIGSTESSKKDELKLIKLLGLHDIQQPLACLRRLLNEYSVYLFIDELDRGWDNSKEAHNFLHGLFYAVTKIKLEKNINVYLALRQDMYNNLPTIFEDTEKIRDEIELLEWDKKQLKALIGYRILNFIPSDLTKDLNSNQAVNLIFEKDTLEYIIDHTLYRPREVILFCNLCLDMYKKSITLEIDYDERISHKTVQLVENIFSNARLNEICEEYEFQYPCIKNFLLLYEHLDTFYSYEHFKKLNEGFLLNFIDEHGDILWVRNCFDNLNELTRILYDIGFVKIFSSAHHKYFAYYQIPFYSMQNIEKVQIHEIFHSVLKLKP